MSVADDVGRPPRFESIEAFLDWVEQRSSRWGERWELVDGEAVRTERPTLNHACLSGGALVALSTRLRDSLDEPFGSGFAVTLGPGNVVFPGVSVGRVPEGDGTLIRALTRPVAFVQVLLPSTTASDLGDKARRRRRAPRSGTWCSSNRTGSASSTFTAPRRARSSP